MGNGVLSVVSSFPLSRFPFPAFPTPPRSRRALLSFDGHAVQRLTLSARNDPFLSITTGVEAPRLAKKPNYDFEKRKKELERKAKTDAKREEKRRKREGAGDDREDSTPGGPGGATPQE